jgi:broad-specificity NMP kinase
LKTIIISGFPGTGKSYITKHSDKFKCHDSDSSEFHFIEGLDGYTVNPAWPHNYINHINDLVQTEEYDFIFISSHLEIRQALTKRDIPYILVMPKPIAKQAFIKRYEQRGSSKQFIDKINDNWDEWNTAFESNVILISGFIDDQFLENIVGK